MVNLTSAHVEDGLLWLALNSHHPNVDAQLECAGDRTTPDIPDPLRVVLDPSSCGCLSHGDEKQVAYALEDPEKPPLPQ